MAGRLFWVLWIVAETKGASLESIRKEMGVE
jgi:hypothetical protein